MPKKSLSLAVTVIGGLLVLLSLFFPWWPNDPISPIRYLFTAPGQGNKITIVYASPDLVAGLAAVFFGISQKLRSKKNYWVLCVLAVAVSLFGHWFWWKFTTDPTLASEATTPGLGIYMGLAGALTTLAGLFLYKTLVTPYTTSSA